MLRRIREESELADLFGAGQASQIPNAVYESDCGLFDDRQADECDLLGTDGSHDIMRYATSWDM